MSVLSTDDPVRLYQQFTTLDQLSRGRAELLAGRGSFTESFPLFGAALEDYDELYEEKLDLLMRIDRRDAADVVGAVPPAADRRDDPAASLRRPPADLGGDRREPELLDSCRCCSGSPSSTRSSAGQPERFAPLVDLYRRAAEVSDQPASSSHVTMSAIGLIARNSQDAKDAFYPYWLETMKYGSRARGWAVPSRADYDEMTRGSQAIFAGSPAEIAERLISVGGLVNADRYGMQMDWSGVPHDRVMTAIELLGTEILPQVREASGLAVRSARMPPCRWFSSSSVAACLRS